MKHFLRADGEVEFIRADGYYWRSGHWQQRAERRSVLAELLDEQLTPEQFAEMAISPGTWYLPGSPP